MVIYLQLLDQVVKMVYDTYDGVMWFICQMLAACMVYMCFINPPSHASFRSDREINGVRWRGT